VRDTQVSSTRTKGIEMTWPNSPSGPDDQEPAGRYEPDDLDAGVSGAGPDQTVHRHPSGIVITDVQVRPVNSDRLRGWATLTFNDAFVVKGIRIIMGNSRLFVAMPSRPQKDGSYQDVAHPINADFRDFLEKLILDEYERYTTRPDAEQEAL
jgi:stage V sporulation protein G